MVSKQTLKLLDALLAGSSNAEKGRLLSLYKEAFCGTQSFKNLKDLLEGCEFHGTVGQELLSTGEEVVKAGFTDAGKFSDRVTTMDYLVEKMSREMDASGEYLLSANVTGTSLNVLDKRLAETATKYYEILFNYVCCLYATLYGESALQNVNVKTGIRSVDLVRNITEELNALLAEANRMEKPRVWRIIRCKFGGANLVNYPGYTLLYGGITPEYFEKNCEQIGPLLFSDRNDPEVLCCGIGYLTSLEPQDGGRLYGAQVVSKPALNCLDDLSIDYDSMNIRALLSTVAGSGVCILDPNELVELLNRYYMIQTARKNLENGCIYCGRRNCSHFRITTEFTM